MLSLGEITPDLGPRPSRTRAVLVSFALHLLVDLVIVPERLPAALKAILFARPSHAAALSGAAAAPAPPPTPVRTQPAPDALRQPSIPLKFAYVKVPNDDAPARNPTAPLFSDRDRRARQEVPTPSDAKRFSIDPHSEGDSIDRVRPDPSRPEGPESPERRVRRAAAGGTVRAGDCSVGRADGTP
jgi:hypothetical protein